MNYESLLKLSKKENASKKNYEYTIYFDMSSWTNLDEAFEIIRQIEGYIKESDIKCKCITSGSFGFSYLEPTLTVEKDSLGIVYGNITKEQVLNLIKNNIKSFPHLNGAEFSIGSKVDISIPSIDELQAFNKQTKILTGSFGLLEPINIFQYIESEGYIALHNALNMGRDEVIKRIADSGLRGRGGGGYLTAEKWKICAEQKTGQKYVICNAAEVDPIAKNTRWILENNPSLVLEGMLIAGFAIGASKGYIYINNEYRWAGEVLKQLIKRMYELNLLGPNILDTEYSFDIEVRYSGGAFICGEETALIKSVEGRRGMASVKPPYPTETGVFGFPTVVNNAETLANVPLILNKGVEWFNKTGTQNSKGTKLITIAGDVKYPVLAEVEFGKSIGEIINDIGGGIKEDKEIKGVQVGGPTGSYLSTEMLDLNLDLESLDNKNMILGSGSIFVFSSEICIVDIIKNNLQFTSDHNCGECVFCREGSLQLCEFFNDISEGKSKTEELDTIIELGELISIGSLCGLGKSLGHSIISAIKSFRNEFMAHINRKRCPAKICKALVLYYIDPDKCKGCGLCTHECPESAINGSSGMIHVIDQSKCNKCGLCIEICPENYNAIVKSSGRLPDLPSEPVSIGSWKP